MLTSISSRPGIRAAVVAGVIGLFGGVSASQASITGFNGLSGWSYTQGDGGATADLPNSGTVHLTTGNSQRRSVFFNTPQDITQFTASFTYRATNFEACLTGQGIAFVMQNSSSGRTALGDGNGGLGYGGLTNSATVILYGDTGPGLTYAGFFSGGGIGSGSTSIAPANAFNFRDLNVTLSYANPILTISIDDPTIAAAPEFVRSYLVGNLATTVGGSTAYVGFTAGTGDFFGNGGSNQYLSNFQFTAGTVPEPTSLSLVPPAAAAVMMRRRR